MRMQIKGPDAGTFAWIPHRDHFSNLPSPGFDGYTRSIGSRLRRRTTAVAFKHLFRSGNCPPPDMGWSGNEEFLRHRWLREFRGILCLHDVTLTTVDGTPDRMDFQCVRGDFYGYTPLRAGAVVSYWRGHGGLIGPHVTRLADRVRIFYEVQYRLNRKLDAISRRMLGYPAANAWSRCRYDLRADGDWSVTFEGWVIPSQTSWVDWDHRRHWDVQGASPAEVRKFIRAGAQSPGPPYRPALTVTGHSSPVEIA